MPTRQARSRSTGIPRVAPPRRARAPRARALRPRCDRRAPSRSATARSMRRPACRSIRADVACSAAWPRIVSAFLSSPSIEYAEPCMSKAAGRQGLSGASSDSAVSASPQHLIDAVAAHRQRAGPRSRDGPSRPSGEAFRCCSAPPLRASALPRQSGRSTRECDFRARQRAGSARVVSCRRSGSASSPPSRHARCCRREARCCSGCRAARARSPAASACSSADSRSPRFSYQSAARLCKTGTRSGSCSTSSRRSSSPNKW